MTTEVMTTEVYFIVTSSSADEYLKTLFNLEKHQDYTYETDEDDLAWQGGQKWTVRLKNNVMLFGESYYDQGENQYCLTFYDQGQKVRCRASTMSPHYSAGGNGTYVSGSPGVHWNAEQIEECRTFLAARQ